MVFSVCKELFVLGKVFNDWEFDGKSGTTYVFSVCEYLENGNVSTCELRVSKDIFDKFPNSNNLKTVLYLEFEIKGKNVYSKVVDFELINKK